jgi:hypothetical protein
MAGDNSEWNRYWFEAFYAKKWTHWREFGMEEFIDCMGSLAGLSDKAFRFFLPAILIFYVENPEEDRVIGLGPILTKNAEFEEESNLKNLRQWRTLSALQTLAVRDVLRWHYAVMNQPEELEALEYFWENAVAENEKMKL